MVYCFASAPASGSVVASAIGLGFGTALASQAVLKVLVRCRSVFGQPSLTGIVDGSAVR